MMKNLHFAFTTCLMACCLIVPVACSDEMEQLSGDDGTGILIEVNDQNGAMATRANYDGFPATEFEAGDEIGVYALSGTTVLANNIKFTKQLDGSWTPASRVVYNPDYTYYAYFPYVSSTPSFNSAGTGDEGKFGNFINSSTFLLNDQSTKENFTKSNLMTAQGTVSGTRTVKFTMIHRRGLAIIADADCKWYYSDDTGTKHEVTPVFTTYIPYKMGGRYYYLMKPNTETTVGGLRLRANAGKYMVSNGGEIIGALDYQYSISTNLGSSWGSYTSTKPSWLTIATNVVDGEPTEFIVTTTRSTSTSTYKGVTSSRSVPGDATLKAAAPVADVDLSMTNNDGTTRGTRTTANCYLVHAPGTYKLPLVYGNAIKDGDETSKDAFYTNNASNTLQNLVNHANDNIISPWIYEHGITVDGAKLIWEDTQGLIKSVGVEGHFLTFEVDAEKIVEGNAIIAATSAGTVVWSWHIWITPETLTELTDIDTGSHTKLDGTSAPYRVAPVNVGQIQGKIVANASLYAGELCRVKASANGVTIEFQVTAKDNVSGGTTYYGPCPYFQWGRKDAMYPPTGAYNSAGTLVNSYTNGTTLITDGSTTTPGATIQHPDYWYYNSYGPYGTDSKYAGKNNYWDMNQTSTNNNIFTATVKTVYDPSPPGFCVPTGNLYNYIYQNYSSFFTWQYATADTPAGRTWTKDTPNVLFPASGFRSNDSGSLSNVGSYGYYWSATAYNSSFSHYLYFDNSNTSWFHNDRANGFAVRAVAEE